MFGLVRSSFGVFQRKGHLFRVNLAPAEMPLVHVVALRMGMVIATFLNIHEAMEGCEIADQMADWNAVSEDEGPAYQMALARTSAGWSAAALYAQANIGAARWRWSDDQQSDCQAARASRRRPSGEIIMMATFIGWFFLCLGVIILILQLWPRRPRILTKEQWRRM